MPSAEIDEALGTGTTVQGGEPTKMRRDGWDVPYRLPRVA